LSAVVMVVVVVANPILSPSPALLEGQWWLLERRDLMPMTME
jgi:hypothetical protein